MKAGFQIPSCTTRNLEMKYHIVVFFLDFSNQYLQVDRDLDCPDYYGISTTYDCEHEFYSSSPAMAQLLKE